MLISKQMQAAMHAQIGHELAASNQYVAIACYFDGEGLQQLGKHYFKQAAEERDHAMRFVRFLMDAGAEVAIPAIPAPRGPVVRPTSRASWWRPWRRSEAEPSRSS